MSFAALMVQVHADPVCEPRLRLAAGMADEMDAALIGIGVETFLPPAEGAAWTYAGGAIAEAVDAQVKDELVQAEQRFRAVCSGVRRGIGWRAFAASPWPQIALQSRAADLVICGVSPGRDDLVDREASAADLVMSCGRPVLAGPAEVDRLDLRHVLVAWKDTREARRAVADALPLLLKAEEVLLVQGPEPGHEDPAISLAAAAEALRRHGVRSAVRVLPADQPTADAILEASVDEDAQLIVAGAYGRSRLREWAFGGVTRRLLQQTAKFVLLSH
jgi:nucleotide-binding universal stress UspA family protein